MVKRGQEEINLATKAANLLKFAILLWIRNGKTVSIVNQNSPDKRKCFRVTIFSRNQLYQKNDKLKKIYIQSAIEFKKIRK